MKALLIISILSLHLGISAQPTSMDIRHTSGNGPFPIYLTFHGVSADNRNIVGDFVKRYTKDQGIRNKNMLYGYETNIGITLNDNHFLGIKRLRVSGLAVELGYRVLDRDFTTKDKSKHMVLREGVTSLRVVYRHHVLYPITMQFQAGLTGYNFLTMREITNTDSVTTIKRYRLGDSATEKSIGVLKDRLIPGLTLRGKILLFDPAGSSGGVGLFVEYSRQITFGNRDLKPLYDILKVDLPGEDVMSFDYGSWSIGIVVPLALRIIGLQ